jgi:hypothetical protein
MSERMIEENVLRGIAEALQQYAPHLLPTIDDLLKNAFIDSPKFLGGTSVYSTVTGVVGWEQGEPVLRALEDIQRRFPNARFQQEWHIDLLVMRWRAFAQPEQMN